MKYKIILAYDGTNYSGWQVQPNAVSIQELLEQALSTVLREETRVVGAGRTDAGVHALGQVAHFTSEKEIDSRKTLLSLNGLLPKDIRVKELSPVQENFHARYSATNKIYHYHLHLDRVLDPFKRKYSIHFQKELNLNLMRECANLFIGTHDFTSFANVGSDARNPVRTIKRIDLVPEEGGCRIEFEGASFLYKMVRNLVGIMLEVGTGKRQISEVKDILEAKDRRKAGRAAAAHGLFLVRIDYQEKSTTEILESTER